MDKRQTFPVKGIKFVKGVAEGTFGDIDNECCFQVRVKHTKSTLTTIKPVLQFGNKEESLYFVAKDTKEKEEWMSKLKQG